MIGDETMGLFVTVQKCPKIHVPLGVHLVGLMVKNGVSWGDIISHLPRHVSLMQVP